MNLEGPWFESKGADHDEKLQLLAGVFCCNAAHVGLEPRAAGSEERP